MGSTRKCTCKDNYHLAQSISSEVVTSIFMGMTYSELVPLGAGAGAGVEPEPDPEFKAAVMKFVPRF